MGLTMTAMLPPMADDTLTLPDGAAWRAWLAEHHDDSPGVWLVTAKKGTAGVSRDEALEEALCHGWIDGQARSRDDATYLQRFTPAARAARGRSATSTIVERLTEDGRMHPAGLAEVERAKADGRWDAAYEGPADDRGPGRPGGTRSKARARGAGDVRDAHEPEPLRRCSIGSATAKTARDAAAADREVRRHARPRRDDLPAEDLIHRAPTSSSTSTDDPGHPSNSPTYGNRRDWRSDCARRVSCFAPSGAFP